jgi:hypothetical protein
MPRVTLASSFGLCGCMGGDLPVCLHMVELEDGGVSRKPSSRGLFCFHKSKAHYVLKFCEIQYLGT